jgi:hypothetical protein
MSAKMKITTIGTIELNGLWDDLVIRIISNYNRIEKDVAESI